MNTTPAITITAATERIEAINAILLLFDFEAGIGADVGGGIGVGAGI